MKTVFDRIVRVLSWVALFPCGLALVDFVLHPLAPDFTYHSTLYRVAAMLLFTPLSLLVGFLIMRRVPGSIIGPLLILWSGVVAFSTVRQDIGPLPFALFSLYEITVGWSALYVLVLHFPDGKIYPPRAAPWVYASISVTILLTTAIFLSKANFDAGLTNPFTVPALQKYTKLITLSAVLIGSPVWVFDFLSPVLRYRRGSQLERQQIKWLALFGGLLATGTILGFVVYPLLTGGEMFSRANNLFSLSFYSSTSLFPPLLIGIAVLRYHLWDIDIVIRKTLVYGALTATLALVFFSGVTLLQQVLGRVTGIENSPIAVVLSTLTIVVLFNPLRQRIQSFIDRRFYRHKYDAEKALAEFAAAARSETDLEMLTRSVLSTVQATLQPASAAVWIKSPGDMHVSGPGGHLG